MAIATIRRACSINNHRFNAISPLLIPTLATDQARATTKMAELSSAAAYFLIITRGFSSKIEDSGSGSADSDGRGELHSELKAVLKSLKSYEFSEAQIDKIIKRYPMILSCRVSTNLKREIEYLVECGFSGSPLHAIIASNPCIFRKSLNALKLRYQFLTRYIPGKVRMVIKRDPHILTQHNAEMNIEYFEKLGVPASSITKLLGSTPRVLRCSKNQLAKIAEETIGLGVQPTAPMFLWHVRVSASLSNTSYEKKVGVFKSLGWSDEDLKTMLFRYPLCFQISEEKLRKMVGFYTSELKMKPEAIIRCPNILMASLTRRVIPRLAVMKLLKEKDLLISCKLSTFLLAPDKRFVRVFINRNLDKIPHLLEAYQHSQKVKADTLSEICVSCSRRNLCSELLKVK